MDATAYILAGTPEAEKAVAHNAANQIEQGTSKLLDIVLSVKDYVTGDDLVQEAKAIEYIATVLKQLDPMVLTRQDVSLMVKYLEARIETAHVVGLKETAIGLQALALMIRFDTNEAAEMSGKIFSISSRFNEYPASVRIEIYKLLDHLVDKHRTTLKLSEGDFITGMLSLAELEKDPRNLMVYFSMLLVILTEWNIKNHEKELWEAVCKYFPITFRPRPDDPIGITANDLKLRLRECIAATDAFSQWVFSFLIEKLDDQVTANVKKDVLQTMTACIRSYDIFAVYTWSSQIWDALKYEVLSTAIEDDMVNEALSTLKAVAVRLSEENLTLQSLDGTMLFKYVSAVIEESLKHFQEPQQKFAKQSGQIIGKIAASSPFAFHLVVKEVFPTLMTVVQDTNALAQKKELLEVFNRVLDARLELVESQESSNFPALSILDAVSESVSKGNIAYGGLTFFRDALFETFALNLTNSPSQETALRITAVRGLLRLVKLPSFLAPIEVGMIVQHLDKLVLDVEDSGYALREEAVLALREVAQLYPQEVADITFSALLGTLPDIMASGEAVKGVSPILEALAKIGSGNYLFPIFVRRLFGKVEEIWRQGGSQFYARIILAGVLYGLHQREPIYSTDPATIDQQLDHARARNVEHYRSMVRTLCSSMTSLACRSEPDGPGSQHYVGSELRQTTKGIEYVDDYLMEMAGRICMTVVRSLKIEDQDWVASEAITLFATLDPGVTRHALTDVQLQLLNAGEDQQRAFVLSMYLLAGLHKEIRLNFNPAELCCTLLNCFYEPSKFSTTVLESFSWSIALLVNKWDGTDVVAQNASATQKTSPQEIVLNLVQGLDAMPEAAAFCIVKMAVTYTASLNLKGDRATSSLLYMLMDELSNKRHGAFLAKEMKYLLAPSELLCKDNYATMRGLYKQRPFAICLPRILADYKACSDRAIKSNYLVALSGILKHTPAEVILPEIEQLTPILLQSMGTIGANVKAASIEVIQTAILVSPQSVEGHMRSIITRLLDRIHNTLEDPSDAPAAVRVLALKCLAVVPGQVRESVTLPHKFEVLRELEFALNDVKRNVREEAVHCRYAWFSLAEAAEDDD